MHARCFWRSALLCAGLILMNTSTRAEVFRVVAGGLERQGGLLVAGAQGAVVDLERGVQMRIGPGSELHAVHKRQRFWLSKEGRTRTHVVAVARGRVEVDNATDFKRAVLVITPQKAVCVSRSGKMTIVVADDVASVVNRGGSVLAGRGLSKLSPLPESFAESFGDSGIERRALLPGTRVAMEHGLYGAFGGKARVSGMRWDPIEGARAYRVRIRQTEPDTGFVRDVETRDPEMSSGLELSAGRYQVTVRGLDRFGVRGQSSEPAVFSVLGVETSEGGYVDRRGNIVAGYDRKVHLTYADGLVMKGGQARWQPVPSEIVLPSDQPMSLHLREAGDSRLVSTRLLARQLQTRVHAGPKRVRWPGDGVRVEVNIADADGGPRPAWVQPRFRVLLGIDELEVRWTEDEDGRFQAEVAPQAGPGPWVVRVEVEDQYGHVLGRDFVEIARRVQLAPQPQAARLPEHR